MTTLRRFALLIVTATLAVQAQAPAVRSPEVHADRTVTFRLRAPQADLVELVGEVLQGKSPQPMTKSSDGVWSITIGPLPPEIWIYNFRIQGVDLPDASNISLMPRAAGAAAVSNFVEIPGERPAFYDARPVPHGDVRMILYESKAMGVDRYFWIYTPPNYDKANAKYPVYYLLHGNGETQSGWVMNGRANIILDNLIADGKAEPMIVVMPHGHPIQSASVGPFESVQPTGEPGLRNFTLFTKDLLEQIIPTVEKNYRVFTDADHRAIGGLSMGAMQSVAIGLAHPDLFHYVLAYSGGFGNLGVTTGAGDETQSPWKELIADAAGAQKSLRLLFLGSGQAETGLVAPGQRLVRMLKDKGINAQWADHPGGHVFSVWRNHLNDSVPMLFKRTPTEAGAALTEPVRVDGGLLRGTVEDGLTVYRGIPYAAPPVGDLRWRAPQPAPKWNGVRGANEYGRACIQSNPAISNLPAPSEDCLFVNVWTPAKRAGERLPVMVWIHGGGFTAGTPAEQLYHGESLAAKGVVVVSVGYRLGVFGFLAHPGLSAESDHHVSGNYGLLDMIAGLRWVQRNISAFGGDATRVTIFGESAGAIAVSQLCASPLAKGLFHAAISESGGSFGPVRAAGGPGENMQPLNAAEKDGVAWTQTVGASSITELRQLPAERLLAASQRQRGVSWPITDGWVIPDDQYKLYQAGRYNDVPVLIGYNSDEGATFGVPRSQEAYVESVRQRYDRFADKLLAAYPGGETAVAKKTARDLTRDTAFGWHTWTWARLQAKTGKSKVFLFYFDEHPEYPADSPRAGYGTPHSEELPYVFRQLREHNRPVPTSKDEAMSDLMRTYWTNFAKTGDPNGAGVPNWPAYSDAKPQMLNIASDHTKPVPIVNEAGLKALDEYFVWRRTTETQPKSQR